MKITIKRKSLYFFLLLLSIFISCKSFSPPSNKLNIILTPIIEPTLIVSSVPTSIPIQTENQAAPIEKIIGEQESSSDVSLLLHDDFESKTLWKEFENEYSYGNYFGGGYRISVFSPNQSVWIVQGNEYRDSITEVSAALMGGSSDNYFGLICRFVDHDNFIMLTISSDGFYGIRKTTFGKEMEFVAADSFLATSSIRKGNQWNKITGECNQEYLRLYVNNQLVIETIDPSPNIGKNGFIVGNLSDSLTEILFDNMFIFDVP